MGFLTLPSGEMSYFAERGYWFRHEQLAYYADGAGLKRMAAFFGEGPAGSFLVALMLLSVALAAAGLLYTTFYGLTSLRNPRREWNPLAVGFVAALVAAPLVFLLSGKPYYPHYIYSLYPLAFVPLLFLFRRAFRSRALGVVLAVVLGAVATGQVAMSAVYYDRVDSVVGVESSGEIVRTIYETGQDQRCHISFDVEKSRLNASPLQRLARWSFARPLRVDRRASLRYRVFSPARWEHFTKLPPHRQTLGGRPVAHFRVLSHAVLAWTER